MRRTRRGFTLLELIIAIFIAALVLGGTLLLMASNLNIVTKATETRIATALAQYQIEMARSVDFPPVYADRQTSFGQAVQAETAINPLTVTDSDFAPDEFQRDFVVRRYVVGYDRMGSELDLTSEPYDKAMKVKVVAYVIRRKGMKILARREIVISRNGLY